MKRKREKLHGKKAKRKKRKKVKKKAMKRRNTQLEEEKGKWKISCRVRRGKEAKGIERKSMK